MKLQNKDIVPILGTLILYKSESDPTPVGGLLTEEVSLGLKRKLQKIRDAILKKYEELQKDAKELEGAEDKEKELTELLEEEFELAVEPASMAMIEAIQTKANYDMAVIEKFAQ